MTSYPYFSICINFNYFIKYKCMCVCVCEPPIDIDFVSKAMTNDMVPYHYQTFYVIYERIMMNCQKKCVLHGSYKYQLHKLEKQVVYSSKDSPNITMRGLLAASFLACLCATVNYQLFTSKKFNSFIFSLKSFIFTS